MITSERTVMTALRRGAKLRIAGYVGWLLDEGDGKRRRVVNHRTVLSLQASGQIERTDDRTARCGETWETKK